MAMVVGLLLMVTFFIMKSFRAEPSSAEVRVRCEQSITIKDIQFACVERVDTAEETSLGLSNTTDLASNEAMLFVFDAPAKYSFWMKDMDYSIDIIWADAEGVIVDIKQNVTPESYPDESFAPSQPAQYVLEVVAGITDSKKIRVGDTIEQL